MAQLMFKSVPLTKPPGTHLAHVLRRYIEFNLVGECFFELKALEDDLLEVPSTGSVDDGYDWRGPVKRTILPINPQVSLEITHFFGAIYDEEPSLSVCRTEYRLHQQNNRLFLVHYLLLDNNGVAVAPPKETITTINNAPYRAGPTLPLQRPPPSVQQNKIPPSHMQPAQNIRMANASAAQPKAPTKVIDQRSSNDETVILGVDDLDAINRMDVSFARLKFMKSITAKLFSPPVHTEHAASRCEDNEASAELVSIVNNQLELLKQEVESTNSILDTVRREQTERRQKLNQLFSSIMTSDNPDILWQQWEAEAGYTI